MRIVQVRRPGEHLSVLHRLREQFTAAAHLLPVVFIRCPTRKTNLIVIPVLGDAGPGEPVRAPAMEKLFKEIHSITA
jgi:hypothetical protein